jgi:cinnamoyl-CoA:phenyllactate CoA-transferase
VLDDPQLWANDYLQAMDYPTGNTRTLVRPPFQLASQSLQPYQRGPYLGEHSEEILEELGYAQDQIDAMHADGVYLTWEDVRADWVK